MVSIYLPESVLIFHQTFRVDDRVSMADHRGYDRYEGVVKCIHERSLCVQRDDGQTGGGCKTRWKIEVPPYREYTENKYSWYYDIKLIASEFCNPYKIMCERSIIVDVDKSSSSSHIDNGFRDNEDCCPYCNTDTDFGGCSCTCPECEYRVEECTCECCDDCGRPVDTSCIC